MNGFKSIKSHRGDFAHPKTSQILSNFHWNIIDILLLDHVVGESLKFYFWKKKYLSSDRFIFILFLTKKSDRAAAKSSGKKCCSLSLWLSNIWKKMQSRWCAPLVMEPAHPGGCFLLFSRPNNPFKWIFTFTDDFKSSRWDFWLQVPPVGLAVISRPNFDLNGIFFYF